MLVNHFQEALKAYAKLLERQATLDIYESDAKQEAGGNKLIMREILNNEPHFKLAVGARNAWQERFRTEALGAIMVSLERLVKRADDKSQKDTT